MTVNLQAAANSASHDRPPVLCTASYARHFKHVVCGMRTHPPCRMRVLACLRRPL